MLIWSQTSNEEFTPAVGILSNLDLQHVSQNLVPGPAASESPENLLQMQILKLSSRQQEQEILGMEPTELDFHQPSGWLRGCHTAGQEKTQS